MKDRTLVLLPTYNERDNVETLCSDIMGLGLDLDILFVDDNSPDGTGELLDRLAEAHPSVKVVHRPRKMGIGSAHLEGIRWAYDHQYARLVTMDCDFSHQPERIRAFLNKCVSYEVVVGSRYLSKDSLREWSLFRRGLTLLGHALTRVLLRMKYDATGGFRAYRLEAIPREVFDLVQSKGYSFLFESLYILHANGFRIREVPIELPARTYGHSKMRLNDAFDSLFRLWKVFTTATFNPSRYRVHRPAYAGNGASNISDVEAWDDYWLKPKSPAAHIYGRIASFYRNYLIKRNLNCLVGEHFAPGSSVLHAGCGGGEVDTDIPGELSVIALDLSAPALRIYDRIHNGSSRLVRGTVFALPLADESVNGIYHLGVMEHFTEEEVHQILTEFRRVLKPDGRMIVFWPPQFGLSVRALKVVHFVLNNVLRRNVRLHPDEITLLKSKSHAEAMLGEAGFALEDYYFGFRDFFTYCMLVAVKTPTATPQRLEPVEAMSTSKPEIPRD